MNNIIMVILLLIFVTLVFIKEGESVQCHICSGPDNCLDGLCKDEVCVKIITKPKRGGKMGVDKKCATKATYGEMKCEKDDSRSSMDYEQFHLLDDLDDVTVHQHSNYLYPSDGKLVKCSTCTGNGAALFADNASKITRTCGFPDEVNKFLINPFDVKFGCSQYNIQIRETITLCICDKDFCNGVDYFFATSPSHVCKHVHFLKMNVASKDLQAQHPFLTKGRPIL
uniref:Sodefrin-like factor n=1 Tax=Romanomermis culicivorax TaxID=13658 RepID=A0A915K963_ROMCU